MDFKLKNEYRCEKWQIMSKPLGSLFILALFFMFQGTGEVSAQPDEATQLAQITFPRDIADLHQALERLADGGILTIQPGVHRFTKSLKIDRDIQLIGTTDDPADTTIESSGEGCLVVTAENAKVQGLTLQVKFGEGNVTFNDPAILVTQGQSEFRKCRITSDSAFGVWFSGSSTDPTFVQCHIFNCRGAGIFVHKDSKGTFNNCEVYGYAKSGIEVQDENSDLKVINCKIYNGTANGILVRKGGKGTFDNCEVYGNMLSGIRVQENSDPKVTNCTIRDNKRRGIVIVSGSRGTYEHNMLSGNKLSAWYLDNPGTIIRTGNQPNE